MDKITAQKHIERDRDIQPVLDSLKALFSAIKHRDTGFVLRHGWEGNEEYLYIQINQGHYTVCITADSKAAIVKDVVDKVIYKF